MAETLIYKFPLIYEILIRTCDYCYSDKAISLLNQLNRGTQKMCYENFHTLLSDKFMKKRVVTVKSKEQKHLKDPRLAYFKVKIIMNKDFDSNMFKKFVKFFDDFQSDSYWLTNQFNQLDLSEGSSSKLCKRLVLVNMEELKITKHLNILYIKQNLQAPLSILFFCEALKLHEPDLIHCALDKVQIAKENFVDSALLNLISCRVVLTDEWCIQKLTKLLTNGSKNNEFIHTVDFLNISIENPNYFIPKIESKIIALKIWNIDLFNQNRVIYERRENNERKRYQNDLVKLTRQNELFQNYLQFLYIKFGINEEFINSFFIDMKQGKLNYLKEFICEAYSLKCLKCILCLYSNFNVNLKFNYPNLNRFGIYFQQGSHQSYRRNYIDRFNDYTKVKIKNFFYLHFREKNEVYSYLVKLNDASRIYASYIHHKYNDELLSLNLLSFMSIDPTIIESIDPTEDILPEEEIVSLINSISSNTYENHLDLRGDSFALDNVQIDVPCKNVVSIELNRYKNMKLDICIDACSNTKQQNDDCEVNLRLSCANIEKTNPSRCIDVLTPNLLSNVQITKIQYYTQAKEFISEIIQQSNKLKSFSYPSSISISDNQDLQRKLKKFTNCIISRVEDMEEDS